MNILSLFLLLVMVFPGIAMAGGEQEIEQVEGLMAGFHKYLQSDVADSLNHGLHRDFQIAFYVDSGLVVKKGIDFLNSNQLDIGSGTEMQIKLMEVYGMSGMVKAEFVGTEKKSTFFLNLVKADGRWLIFSATVDAREFIQPGK